MSKSKVVLSNRFTCAEPRVWLGRIKLFEDHVQLTGWQWAGRFEHRIPLQEIEEAVWQPAQGVSDLVLYLADDTSLVLSLRRAAGLWKFEIDRLRGVSEVPNAQLPEEAGAAMPVE